MMMPVQMMTVRRVIEQHTMIANMSSLLKKLNNRIPNSQKDAMLTRIAATMNFARVVIYGKLSSFRGILDRFGEFDCAHRRNLLYFLDIIQYLCEFVNRS